jgi:gliding motility-associated-like protein
VGTIVINANGTYTFTPVANYNGTVPTITYTVSDGQGGTATATLIIVVTPVNDNPTPTNDNATTLEDTPASGNVLTNDTDVDANTLSVTQFVIGTTTYTAGQTATIAGVGTIVINANGTYTFTPVANYNGTVPTITYTVSDGQGGTATATLIIVVTPVNDNPVAVNDNATTLEDSPASGNVLTNDSDIEGNTLTVTQFVIGTTTTTAGQTATIAGVGTIVINANGTYTFTPAANYYGTVPPITYTVSDGQGGTATAVLNISVTSVADPSDIQLTTATFCGSGSASLVASTTTVTNPIFNWYTNASLTNLVFTGATYTTPVVSSTTTYYVSVSGTGTLANQSGNGQLTTIVINSLPATPIITLSGPTTFCVDDSVVFSVASSAGISYQWFANASPIAGATSNTLKVNTAGNYTLVVTNALGCKSIPTSVTQVKVPCVKGIYMPTVFTPNGDRVNDVVKPSIPGMKQFNCYKIYNRWGNMIFETKDSNKGWDGKAQGKMQPSESYIWIVLGEDGQGKPMKKTGMITLVR